MSNRLRRILRYFEVLNNKKLKFEVVIRTKFPNPSKRKLDDREICLKVLKLTNEVN